MKKILNRLSEFFQKPASPKKAKPRKTRGQSLVEVAIAFPFMIMLLGGVIEFGFMINYYLSLLDATRFAARQYSGFDPFDPDYNTVRNNVNWFYIDAAGQVAATLDPKIQQPAFKGRRLILDPLKDDVIISVYSAAGSTVIRYPTTGEYHIFGPHNAETAFSVASIQTQHQLVAGTPNAGILIVEVVYNYHQVLSLPWMAPFGNPIAMRAYSIFPIIAAEP